MSIVAVGWDHFDIVEQVEKNRLEKNVVVKLIEDCLKIPNEKWQFNNCLAWLDSWPSGGDGRVALWISSRTTCSYHMNDGRVEPYDSMLEHVTKEYQQETVTILRKIFSTHQTREELVAAYPLGIPELKEYEAIQTKYDLLAVDIRKKAANKKLLIQQRMDECMNTKGNGCLVPIAIAGGLLILSLCR